MTANPEAKIIRSAKTRDGVTAFLHEDGTISSRVTTFGFSRVPAELMQEFFNRIGNVHSADVAKAIKASTKGKLPNKPRESVMAANARDAFNKAAIHVIYDRSITWRS